MLRAERLQTWVANDAYYRFVEPLPTQGKIAFVLRFDAEEAPTQVV